MRKAGAIFFVVALLGVGVASNSALGAEPSGKLTASLAEAKAPSGSSLVPWEDRLSPAAAPFVEGDKLLFFGSAVQYVPHVYAIFWGSNWNKEPGVAVRSQLQHMYEEVSGSAWQGILTQYFGKDGVISHTNSRTFYTDASSQPSNPNFSEIYGEIGKAISSQGWTPSPSNDQFVVLLAPGTFSGSGPVVNCAEHTTYTYTGSIPNVTVSSTYVPYEGDEPFFAHCASYGGGNAAKTTSMAASHEYAESLTDPFFGGWHGEGAEEEVADLCPVGQELAGGAFVTQLWDNYQNQCSISDANPPQLHATGSSTTGITTSEATFHGTVNPGGLEASYYFEYGKTTSYGTKVPTTAVNIGSGVSDINVSQAVSGLESGRVYHVRLTLSNPRGTTHSLDQTFITEGPPVVTTEAASAIEKTTATLNGTVNPNGKETKYYFEYGLTSSYGTKTTEVGIGSGTADLPESVGLSGLVPNTTYHYRIAAVNSFGTANGVDKTFKTKASPPVVTTGVASNLTGTGATLNGTVNPEGFETSYYFEYGTTLEYGTKTASVIVGSGTSPVEVSQAVGGLKEGTKYHFRIVASSSNGERRGLDQTFTTLIRPAVETTPASNLGTIEPQLNATVNPNGSDTHYQFEYGQTEAYGSKIPIPAEDIGSGTSPVTVSKKLSGLKQNTVYHYRVVAESAGGLSQGTDQSFTTIGTKASTEPPSGVSPTEATLKGSVNPEGLETTYQFEYGVTAAYGSKVPVSPKSVGKGTSDVKVSQAISSLQPLTRYHYRIVATNTEGATYGTDQTFTTGSILHWYGCTKQAGKYTNSECAKEGAPSEWESVRLKEAEKTTITAKGNPIAFTSTQSGVVTTFSCETEVVSASLENPTGAGNGVGNAEVKYKGCKPEGVAAEKGCKVENTANFASKLALTMIDGKANALLTPSSGETFAKFSVSSCSVGALNGTYELKGTMRGLYSNSASKVEFNAETTAEGLSLRGQKTTAVGSVKLETSAGAFIKAAPEVHWFGCNKQGGGKYANSTCTTEGAPNEYESVQLKAGEKTTIVGKGNPIAFTATVSGVKGTLNCETEVASPSLENPSGGANGIGNAEVKYKGCKAEGTWGEKSCKVETTANFASKLELAPQEGKAPLVILKPTSGEVFAKFNFTGCSVGALNGAYELKGTMRGLYSNSASKVEFNAETTAEGLTLRGQKATAVGSVGLETSGGGYVRAE
jgi:hypothetical protein